MLAEVSWDWSDAAIVIATILGPILAVQIERYLQRQRSVEDRRQTIFRTLMATRAASLSPAHVEALNAVPVEFYGQRCKKLKEINDRWKTYLDHHTVQAPATDVWFQKRQDLFIDLLYSISKFLGYEFSRSQLERDIYSPQGHSELEAEQTVIRKGLVALLNGQSSLNMAVKEFPYDEAASKEQEELRSALQAWLDGSRTVKVDTGGNNASRAQEKA